MEFLMTIGTFLFVGGMVLTFAFVIDEKRKGWHKAVALVGFLLYNVVLLIGGVVLYKYLSDFLMR